MKQLEIFVSVYIYSSITKAADENYLSVPAAWKHLQKLESECNTSLFLRTKNGLILTDAGKPLLEYATLLLDEAKNLSNVIEDIKKPKSTLSVAIPVFFLKEFFDLLKVFLKQHPDIHFTFTSIASADEMKQALCDNCHDLYLTGRKFNAPEYNAYELYKYSLAICINNNFKLRDVKNMELPSNKIIYLPSSDPQLTKWTTNILKKHNLTASIEYHRSYNTIHGIITTNNGIGLLPDFLFNRDENIKPYFDDQTYNHVMLYAKKDLQNSRIFQSFTKFIFNQTKKITTNLNTPKPADAESKTNMLY